MNFKKIGGIGLLILVGSILFGKQESKKKRILKEF